MKLNSYLPVAAWCLVVFIAAFVTWAKVPFGPGFFGDVPFKETFGDLADELTLTMNGWNGRIHVGGVELPNWLVAVAAGVVGAMASLRISGKANPSVTLERFIALWGVIQVITFIVLVLDKRHTTLGIGSLASLVAMVGLLVTSLRGQTKRPAGVTT
jgi:hypothetical protein